MATDYSDEDVDYIYGRIMPLNTAFEGASTSYKQGLRGLYEGQADDLAVRELRYLQQRSASAVRNNGYAKTALNNWKTNANAVKVVWKTPNGKIHKDMQKLWDEFAANPSFDGYGDYSVLQSISNASIFIAGNSYIRKLIVRTDNKAVVPFKLQVIPWMLHNVTHNSVTAQVPNEVTKFGITFRDSVPVQYYFKKSNIENRLGDIVSVTGNVIVPAEEIVHTFIRDEPGQWLGIPLLAPILVSLYELDELIDATVSKQKVAQAIAMIVEQASDTLNRVAPGSVGSATDPNTGKEKIVFKNKGGTVQYLNKGEKINFFQGGDIGANFGKLIESELRRIASTLDQAYHDLTGDTSGLNFSSLAHLSIKLRTRIEYLYNFVFIPLRDKPIAEAFKEFAVLYRPKVASATPYFQLPRWRSVDDLKDGQADILELQNGLGTYTDKLAERGLSFEDILADRETLKELEQFGIVFTPAQSSPSMNQANNVNANSNSTST